MELLFVSGRDLLRERECGPTSAWSGRRASRPGASRCGAQGGVPPLKSGRRQALARQMSVVRE